jgi:hypothetical protein
MGIDSNGNKDKGLSVPLNKNCIAFVSLCRNRVAKYHLHHTRRWPCLEIINWRPRFGRVVGKHNSLGM